MREANYSIATPYSHEITIEKSRFITHLFPTDTQDEAKAHIQTMKRTYADASHNCSAYILQHETKLQKSSDDGEPSGTAGVPMMQALNGRQMINITAVVTRYFGGIKLGAGGLVRAYSHAVLETLDLVPLMIYQTLVISRIEVSHEELNIIYVLQARTNLFAIEHVSYEPLPLISIMVEKEKLPQLEKELQAHLLRHIKLTIIEEIIKKVPNNKE
jgi:uncharacterized YigZ family protein